MVSHLSDKLVLPKSTCFSKVVIHHPNFMIDCLRPLGCRFRRAAPFQHIYNLQFRNIFFFNFFMFGQNILEHIFFRKINFLKMRKIISLISDIPSSCPIPEPPPQSTTLHSAYIVFCQITHKYF